MAASNSYFSKRINLSKYVQQGKSTKRRGLNLTDLDNDVLTIIFRNLNCNDIVKMFAVHPIFVHSACDAYKYVCKKMPLSINLSPMNNDYMDPYDMFFAFERVGSLTTEIQINGRISDNRMDRCDDKVMKDIIKYCPGATDLKLKYIETNIRMEHFRRFKELKKLKIHFSRFGGQMVQLQNVTHFHGTIEPNRNHSQRFCNDRQHYHQTLAPNMTHNDLLAFFNMNPQLKCVKLLVKYTCKAQCNSDVVDMHILRSMDETLPLLEKLMLDLGKKNNFDSHMRDVTRNFRNLKKLTIIGNCSVENILNFLAISNRQLEELTCCATSATGTSLILIQEYQNLKKISLSVGSLQCTATDIINLVLMCEHLELLHIKCEQNITAMINSEEIHNRICYYLRNRTNIEIKLTVARQREFFIDDSIINRYHNETR